MQRLHYIFTEEDDLRFSSAPQLLTLTFCDHYAVLQQLTVYHSHRESLAFGSLKNSF